jgi:hypothetical protein
MTSFLPSMLTIDPVKWSPFFNETCSACKPKAPQTTPTSRNNRNCFNTLDLFSFQSEQQDTPVFFYW